MHRIIVERSFDPPITDDGIAAVSQWIGGCLELCGVRSVGSHVSMDRRRMVCVYEAADAQSVRDVQSAAQAPVEHVWPAEIMAP
jgi:hypothetical protein